MRNPVGSQIFIENYVLQIITSYTKYFLKKYPLCLTHYYVIFEFLITVFNIEPFVSDKKSTNYVGFIL